MPLPRTPIPAQWLFPGIIFRGSARENTVYLTFDDGPDPQATAFVLQTLAAHDAGATFFAVGENAQKYPQLLEQIAAGGHSLGNHTMKHLNGFHTPPGQYLADTEHCRLTLAPNPAYRPLFRPPYGRITPAQYRRLRRQYRVVLWDVIAEDYRTDWPAEACLKKLKKQTRRGSVIVFHDSARCLPMLRQVLPAYMEFLDSCGLQSKSLDQI